ncbi:MAG: glycosyltransferase [Akkermansia muciniphila]
MISIAIIIPAYNEELTIREVMQDFHNHCPEAAIYVIDNNSSDKTAEIARKTYEELGCSGALLRKRKGKAMAVKRRSGKWMRTCT